MSARLGDWALGAVVLVTALAFVPAVREWGKGQSFLWSPVSDWRPVVYLVPLLLAGVVIARGRRIAARIAGRALFVAWAVIGIFQLFSGYDF